MKKRSYNGIKINPIMEHNIIKEEMNKCYRENNTIYPAKKIKTFIDENESTMILLKKREEELNATTIDKLPLFILAEILSKTGYKMMFKVMLVCKKWRKAANTKIFYESMLRDNSQKILFDFEIPEANYELVQEHFKDRTWKEKFQLKRIINTEAVKESENKELNNQEMNDEIEKEKENHNGRILGTKIIDRIGFYEGELKANKQDGKGILYKMKLGKVYEGDFVEGKITGKGKRIWPNKDTYDGDFKESKRDGNGTLKLVGTGVYIGAFKNDKREGTGTMQFDNGDTYEGDWRNDMANGKGIFSSKSGYIYDGDWVDNHKSGKGKLIYQRGTYDGDWLNNKAHGKGQIIFKNGTKYIGDMYENSWHGKGMFYWNDGRVYEGDFHFSKQQGNGTIKSSDGNICYTGSFRNNRPHGEGTLFLKSGFKYIGHMKNGLKDGHGKIYDSENHLCMSGVFSEGNFISGDVNHPKNNQSIQSNNQSKVDSCSNNLIINQHQNNQYDIIDFQNNDSNSLDDSMI